MELVVPQIMNGGVDTVFVMVCGSSIISFYHYLIWFTAKLEGPDHKYSQSLRIPVLSAIHRTQSTLSHVTLRG